MYVYVTVEADLDEQIIKGVHAHIHQASAFAWSLFIKDRLKDYAVSFYCGTIHRDTDTHDGPMFVIEQWNMKNNTKVCTWYLNPEQKLKEIGIHGATAYKKELGFWMKIISDKGCVPGSLWNDCMFCDEPGNLKLASRSSIG